MRKELLYRTDHQGVKGPIFIGKEKLLVYERDNKTDYYPNHIDIPGGGKEEGETVFQTFKREVEEEFNLSISRKDIKFVKAYPSTRFPGKKVYFVVALLPENVISNVKFSSEGINHRIMRLDEYLSSPKSIPFLRDRTEYFLNKVGL